MIKYNKQRNYRRNGDIVYHQDSIKKNTTSIIYRLDETPITTSAFTLDETNGNLYYLDDNIEETQEYTRGTITKYVVPYKYIWIDTNGEMVLYADCPTVITDEFFELDENNGNFYINI